MAALPNRTKTAPLPELQRCRVAVSSQQSAIRSRIRGLLKADCWLITPRMLLPKLETRCRLVIGGFL